MSGSVKAFRRVQRPAPAQALFIAKRTDSRGQASAGILTAVAVIGLIVLLVISIRSYDSDSGAGTGGTSATTDQTGSGSRSERSPDAGGATATTGAAGATAAPGAGSALTAGSRSLLPVPPREELASLTGNEVVGRGAPVQAVVADEGFWVGTSATDRIFVFLTPAARGTAGESPFTVQPGQRADLTGTLRALSGEPNSLGVDDAEGASTLRSQGHYVEARSVRLSG